MALPHTQIKKRLHRLIIAAVAAGVTILVLNFKTPANRFEKLTSDPARSNIILKVGSLRINAKIARTPEEHRRGLSGLEYLPEFSGLLFVFQNNTRPGFWMKEMKFPLDIIWIDKNLKITGIERNVTPDTFPKIFRPERPIRYVLEINTGLTEDWNIDKGNILRFLDP